MKNIFIPKLEARNKGLSSMIFNKFKKKIPSKWLKKCKYKGYKIYFILIYKYSIDNNNDFNLDLYTKTLCFKWEYNFIIS